MRLFRDVGSPETDAGEWVTYQGSNARARLRPLTAAKDRELERRYLGKRRTFKFQGNVQVVDVEGEQGQKLLAARASWCLLDTEGFEVEVADEAAAAKYAELLGAPVKVGPLKLDGKWSDAMKAHVFDAFPPVAIWIVTEQAKLLAGEAEEAEGKDET